MNAAKARADDLKRAPQGRDGGSKLKGSTDREAVEFGVHYGKR